jgi:hypothetical protein
MPKAGRGEDRPDLLAAAAWLEAQGEDAAIASYERAMAVDIQFMDLSERIYRLTAGRRE